jgi:hypothetical protein
VQPGKKNYHGFFGRMVKEGTDRGSLIRISPWAHCSSIRIEASGNELAALRRKSQPLAPKGQS